jgi:hypothetical protein
MVILRATSILGGQNKNKGIMCSITQFPVVANVTQETSNLSDISWSYPMNHTIHLTWIYRKSETRSLDTTCPKKVTQFSQNSDLLNLA